MSDYTQYLLMVVVVLVIIFSGATFEKHGYHLCVQEALKAKVSAQDIERICK